MSCWLTDLPKLTPSFSSHRVRSSKVNAEYVVSAFPHGLIQGLEGIAVLGRRDRHGGRPDQSQAPCELLRVIHIRVPSYLS